MMQLLNDMSRLLRGRTGRYRFGLVVITLIVSQLSACVGGIPKIPADPEQNLEKADAYYARGRFYQAGELYRGFLQRHPGHDRSDYAQFRLGESHFGDEEYALAVVEYRILVTNYGYSDYVDDAYYKEALALFRQSPDYRKDQSFTIEALRKLEQFVQVFGNSDRLPEALETIKEIHVKLAHKELDNAKWYMRQKQYLSAMIYLDKIIEEYPDNDYWARALYYRGWVSYQRGEEEDAIPYLSRTLEYPGDVDAKAWAQALLRQLNPNQK